MKLLSLLSGVCGLMVLAACEGGSGGGGAAPVAPTGGTTAPVVSTPVETPPKTDPIPASAPSGGFGDTDAALGNIVDYTRLAIPATGSHTLHVLSPNVIQLVLVNRKPADPAPVDSWDFVNGGTFVAPATSKLNVTVNGQPVTVQQVGFKRRALYAPIAARDLRVINQLVLQLGTAIADGQTVEVKNPDGTLWSSSLRFTAQAQPLRYSPAVHVNQEGYVPAWPKKASVGYYLGNLGEMTIPTLTFSLVHAGTGAAVFHGNLAARLDSGWPSKPAPYQKVYEADFSAFSTPGEYRLVVPGLGASLPFLIDDGIAMAFARTYASGLYHQRCGMENTLPFTRFVHGSCHTAPASVPASTAGFDFTWKTIAIYANTTNAENPVQAASRLTSEGTQLYPFVRRGTVDVSGGHHDAGDYSKYTTNSTSLLHALLFAADSFAGVAALDNLGLPESGDAISDVLQEAKIEADYLAKMQDSDGGFYFLVYPREREYEYNVLPDQGDPQVVWPKTTSATAAAVAALAEAGSSPRMKQHYPAAAALYLQKAVLGWQFLTTAIARHGKAGAYQKITHYGDAFAHDDELAWAAAAMFAATGDATYHQTLKQWFDPAASSTWFWGWWRCYAGYGNAIRTYAFAARSGRLSAQQLDAAYLAKCEAQIRAAGDDALSWSQQSAYGTSFPDASKRVMSAGWYFSSGQAFDLTVAFQLEARADYLDAIIRNLNYEGGSNATNVAFITGLGWKRQHEIVHQYANNDARVLPVNGIPLGNLQTGPVYTGTYGTELSALSFPSDSAGTGPHPFYDRWTDTHNVTTEFVNVDQARSLASVAFLAALSPARAQAWRSATGQITGLPATVAAGSAFTVSLAVPGLDLGSARIVWEASNQEPAYGATYSFTPQGFGAQWIEAEAQWPDGRRVSVRQDLFSENGLPTLTVAATDDSAAIGAVDTGTYTFSRTGSTAEPLTIHFRYSGSAAKWTDYYRADVGDMPETMTFPAGARTLDLTFTARANSRNANPQTVILTLDPGQGYNLGSPNNAIVTIK